MSSCAITASSGSTEATVIVVGYAAVDGMPAMVEKVAASIASGEVKGPQTLVTDDGPVVLVGVDGEPWLVGGEDWRLTGKAIIEALRAGSYASAKVLVDGSAAEVSALVEGIELADYRFLTCRSGSAAKRSKVTIRIPGQAKAVRTGVANAKAQNLAREVCDAPGNLMNPKTFVARARKELRGLPLTIKVISGLDALTKAGFPGLVQVGQAGSAPPALLEVSYVPKGASKGRGKGKRSSPHLALVGKGITFDAGGISLKPGAGMWEMKGDMGGAAAVLAAIKLIGERKGKVPVTAYMALAENLADSDAQRPGDIYQARNGTYIHVDNTDAEGRLVLSDVLTYACEQGATHMADAATLTGACLVALGTGIAGLMGNDEEWTGTVRDAGQTVGEELWPLPLYGEYRRLLDHPHADINNIGGRFAGTMTAGIFLQQFVDPSVRWCHLDIAGPAMRGAGNWRYFTKGSTGFACRTMAALAERL